MALGDSSEDESWDSESNVSCSTFASGKSDFRVVIYEHERLALELLVSRLMGEDSSDVEMEIDDGETGGRVPGSVNGVFAVIVGHLFHLLPVSPIEIQVPIIITIIIIIGRIPFS